MALNDKGILEALLYTAGDEGLDEKQLLEILDIDQKRNPARFDFDFCFPKMPSYFRRAAVQHALG